MARRWWRDCNIESRERDPLRPLLGPSTAGIDAAESPPWRESRRLRRLGRNLHDLISLRLTPRAIPVTLSLSMRAPCGGSNHSRDDPFYPQVHLTPRPPSRSRSRSPLLTPFADALSSFMLRDRHPPCASPHGYKRQGRRERAHPSFPLPRRPTPRPSAPLVLRRALYVGKFAIFPFNISTPRGGGRHTI